MGFCCVSWRSLRPVGLLALKLLLRQLPTGAASRKIGSGTVGASWFWLGTLSLKIRAFWGGYGGRGADLRFLWAAVGWHGGAASYAGTGVVVA